MRKILIAILLCWSASLYAAEDKKEYNASFSKDGVEEVVIVNSYGDVEISQAADSLCTVVWEGVALRPGANEIRILSGKGKNRLADGYTCFYSE